MVAKKRKAKKASKKELRRRALAGWDTRRRNLIEREEKLIDTAVLVTGKKRKRKRLDNSRITPDKLKEMLLQERSERERLEAYIADRAEVAASQMDAIEKTYDWLPTRFGSPERLHRDMTLALHPSRLRHLDEAPELFEKLDAAKKKGEYYFIDMCDSMAEFYSVPLAEVYTLFFSM